MSDQPTPKRVPVTPYQWGEDQVEGRDAPATNSNEPCVMPSTDRPVASDRHLLATARTHKSRSVTKLLMSASPSKAAENRKFPKVAFAPTAD